MTMGLFRIFRPITVEAKQCTRAETIATDIGFTNVNAGDWVIRGEGGESYILNNDFFQRTFTQVEESVPRHEPRQIQLIHSASKIHPISSGSDAGHRLRVAMRRDQKAKQSI
jgi:hypothetical protein